MAKAGPGHTLVAGQDNPGFRLPCPVYCSLLHVVTYPDMPVTVCRSRAVYPGVVYRAQVVLPGVLSHPGYTSVHPSTKDRLVYSYRSGRGKKNPPCQRLPVLSLGEVSWRDNSARIVTVLRGMSAGSLCSSWSRTGSDQIARGQGGSYPH